MNNQNFVSLDNFAQILFDRFQNEMELNYNKAFNFSIPLSLPSSKTCQEQELLIVNENILKNEIKRCYHYNQIITTSFIHDLKFILSICIYTPPLPDSAINVIIHYLI
jgi:hypothetical protein